MRVDGFEPVTSRLPIQHTTEVLGKKEKKKKVSVVGLEPGTFCLPVKCGGQKLACLNTLL